MLILIIKICFGFKVNYSLLSLNTQCLNIYLRKAMFRLASTLVLDPCSCAEIATVLT